MNSAAHRTNPIRILQAGVLTLLAAAAVWTMVQHEESRVQVHESPINPPTAPASANTNPPTSRSSAIPDSNKTSPPQDHTVTATDPSLTERSVALEKKSLRKLDQLREALNLTKAQQQRVFSILVRSDPSYDPSMRVAGETGAPAISEPNDAIVEILDPARQEKFELALIDDASWWDATMARIESARADESSNAQSQITEEPTETNFR